MTQCVLQLFTQSCTKRTFCNKSHSHRHTEILSLLQHFLIHTNYDGCIGGNFEFSVLSKDALVCGLEESGIDLPIQS